MARTALLNNSPKSAGAYPFGPLAVPSGVTRVTLDIDMTQSGPGDDMQWSAEFSYDGGTTWPMVLRGQFLGGIPKRLDGTPIPAELISIETITIPNGTNRLVRGEVLVTGATRKIPIGIDWA